MNNLTNLVVDLAADHGLFKIGVKHLPCSHLSSLIVNTLLHHFVCLNGLGHLIILVE